MLDEDKTKLEFELKPYMAFMLHVLHVMVGQCRLATTVIST
jgi:hypothetical protein